VSVDALVIFTRLPRPGQAKTRLIPALGPEGAADLQRELTEATVATARRLREQDGTRVTVRFTDGDAAELATWLGPDLAYRDQGDGDLGTRMRLALAAALAEGADRAVVIGCDCPALDADGIGAAFAALADHDLVLGPARDGGYYLLGLKRIEEQLFIDLPWGSPAVLETTRERAAAADLRTHELPVQDDIDTPEDLRRWRGQPG